MNKQLARAWRSYDQARVDLNMRTTETETLD